MSPPSMLELEDDEVGVFSQTGSVKSVYGGLHAETPHAVAKAITTGSKLPRRGSLSHTPTVSKDFCTKIDSKKGDKTRKKILKTHKFFMELTDQEREMFAIVTQDISLQNTGGLQSIKRRLWEGRELFKLAAMMAQIAQVVLNVSTTVRMCTMTLHNVANGSNTLSLTSDRLRICSPHIRIDGSDATQIGCFETGLVRKRLTQAFLLTEAALVCAATLYITWSSLFLMVCRKPSSYAGRRYFVMMALPKITARFSLVMFLHMANADRLKSFLLRGEFRCLASLCFDSLRQHMSSLVVVPGEKTRVVPFVKKDTFASAQACIGNVTKHLNFLENDNISDGGNPPKPSRCRWRCKRDTCCQVVGLVSCLVLIVAALHSLLIKMMLLYFVIISSYTEWDIKEWLTFLGFVNQLSGISLSSEVETLRILLFRFGGETTKWTPMQIQACGTYFRFLSRRLVEQTGRRVALVLMWTMSSADLQKLFQGHQRLHEQNAVLGDTIEVFERIADSAQLINMRDKLLRNFRNREDTLEQSLELVPPDQRLELLNFVQTRAIGELRLAAQVQEHIWQWKKVLLHECGRITDATTSSTATVPEDQERLS